METSFASAIADHLELKSRRGARTGAEEEKPSEPESNPTRKAAAAQEVSLGASEYEDALWGRPREFDWGD